MNESAAQAKPSAAIPRPNNPDFGAATIDEQSADSYYSKAVRAPNVLLMGMPGAGKTHALRTLVDAGLEVFILFTEPGMEVLADTDPDQVHWHYVAPTSGSLEDMLKKLREVNRLSWDVVQKQVDVNKKSYDSAVKLLESMVDFPCDRTGKTFGNVGQFGQDKAFVIDSLSGLNHSMMQLVVGGALGVTQPQWGAAMKTELNLINQMCFDSECTFVLTAHLDRLMDEVNGGMIIQVKALGQKNAPEIPKNFSDVILCKRDKGEWIWATESSGCDLKARNVPWSPGFTPSFVPLMDTWRKRIKEQN
jgi:hypothetical protein